MKTKLHWIFDRFMRPAGEDESGSGGGTTDRGDDFVPTGDDANDIEDQAGQGGKAADDDAEGDDEEEKDVKDEKDEKDDKEEDKEPKGDAKKREPRIPLSRHKEMLDKARAERDEMAQRLAQFQNGKEVATVNEEITASEAKILELEAQYTSAIADGEVEKATKLMRDLRNLDKQVAEAKSDLKIAAAESRAVERTRFAEALTRIEASYPQLDEDHESFDKELMKEVVDLKAAYESRGMTPTAAMQKAVRTLVGVQTTRQEAAIETTPRVKEKDVAAERKKDAVKKTAETVAKQPPSTTKVGMDSDKAGGGLSAKDVMKMRQEDFAKLPDEVLAKMRGDEL